MSLGGTTDERMDGLRVVVTGGAGFIGSSLVRDLVGRGADVIAVDNLANGKRENLDGVVGSRCRLLEADIRDDVRMADALADAQVVYNLACMGVRHSLHSPAENHDVNATGTLRLLEVARTVGVPRFVQVSTSEVYGTARYAPMAENHPTEPLTVYGASKLAGERYAHAYHRTYGFATVVVRPFNAYGPRCHHEGDSGEVIPKFMIRGMAGCPIVVLGDGLQTRDFTYVTDTARGIAAAGLVDRAVGGTFNLGRGSEISINDVAQAVVEVLDRDDVQIVHDAPRPGDVLRLCADSTTAQAVLGFTTSVGFEEGLTRLYAWYRRSGRSPEEMLGEERVRNWFAPDLTAVAG